MNILSSESEIMRLFAVPFEPKKFIYSLTSDFFSDGNLACKIREKQLAIDIDDEELLHNPLPEFPCGERGCRVNFNTVHDFEVHYRTAHSIVCSECQKSFPSYSLLDAHILERHDSYFSAAKEKNLAVFNCLVNGCCEMFSSLESRNEHAIKVHNYPVNYKFQHLRSSKELEKMDTSLEGETPPPTCSTSKSHKYVVPNTICFGRGSMRSFVRKKHKSTDISMKELADAL